MKNIKYMILAVCLGGACQAVAEVAVIGNPDIEIQALTEGQVKDLFLCKTKYLVNGEKMIFAYQERNSATKKEFDSKVLDKSAMDMKRHWARLNFSGECKAPVILDGDDAMRTWVKKTPGAIGYIDAKNITDADKVLLRKYK